MMNSYEVQKELNTRIVNIEAEESRLQQWLECLQRVGAIAAEWNEGLSEIQLKPEVQSEPVLEEPTPVEAVADAIELTEEDTQPEAEGQPACWDRDSFERNLEQLRQRGQQENENQRLQDREFDQLREQLCASRPKSSLSGRLGTLMSFLIKV
jgi:hypothetical protein